MNTKEKINNLRSKGKSYNEISKILNISKSTISYHCINLNINNPISKQHLSFDKINKVIEYCKNHTIKETSVFFKISPTTVKKYSDKKNIKYTEEEKKIKNYEKVKSRRQKLKEMAVEYLGGKCIECGYNKCIWSLSFHHRNSKEKDFTISQNSTLRWDKIKNELDKCDLLCSNCHAELHYKIYKLTCKSSD